MIALCGVLIMIVIIIIKVKHDSKRIDEWTWPSRFTW
jgi:hypothetical protein